MVNLLRRCGGAVCAMALPLAASGAFVCAGWLGGFVELTRLTHESTVMQVSTGFLFMLVAASLVAGRRGMPRLAALAGGLVTLFALLTLYEYLSGASLGIDTLFLDLGPQAIRMAPNTTVTFVLAGAGLLLLAVPHRAPWALGIVPMLGALVVAIGATAAIGYLMDFAFAAQWARFARMALLTSLDVVLMGAALVAAVIAGAPRAERPRLPWIAASAGVGMAALAGLGWYTLQSAPEAAQAHVANLVLALGLAAAALLTGTIAQAGFLRQRSRELAALNETLRATSEEVRDLYENAPCGYHSLDAERRFVRVNQTELAWLGYSREELLGRYVFDVIAPASRALAESEWSRFREKGSLYNLELELLRRDGTTLPVLVSATAVFDAQGRYQYSRSTLFDITDRKRAEAALRESESRLQLLLEGLQTAVVLHGPDTGIRYVNPAAIAMLGLTREQLLGKTTMDPYWHFVREDETPLPLPEYPVSRVLESRSSLHDCVVGIRAAPDEPTRWALVNAIPELAPDGSVREIIVSFMDISDRKRRAEEMEQLALTDSLTGLATRRHFMAEAERELSRARRAGAPLSLLMLDLDRFKSINDEHGHAVGDLVLVQLARAVRLTLRDSDMAGRLGGEEFCVLMPGIPEGVALEVAERLRLSIAAASVTLPSGRVLRFTASIGLASLEPDDAAVPALIERADQAMYEAKRSGRNRVNVARPAVTH